MTVDTAGAFEEQMLPHLDAAFNLARYLVRSDDDASDVVQEAYLRALRYFPAFKGGNARGWLLAIVRHTAFTRLKRDRVARITTEFNEELHSAQVEDKGPERDLVRGEDAARLQRALDRLPPKFREVLALRELEDLSYQEIARIVRVPAGTVMSRLARARERLARALKDDEGAAP